MKMDSPAIPGYREDGKRKEGERDRNGKKMRMDIEAEEELKIMEEK